MDLILVHQVADLEEGGGGEGERSIKHLVIHTAHECRVLSGWGTRTLRVAVLS